MDTGARGQGFGLATGGGAGKGMELDVTNFCCPEYLEQVRIVIERAWDAQQGVKGEAVVKFTILRDGTLEMVNLFTSSGFYALDNASTRAVVRAQRVPALPPQFPGPMLTIRMRFMY